jgi:anti-sigma B factor antagonist
MDEPVRVCEQGDGVLDVSLCGDIDFTNSAAVRETIRTAVATADPKVIRVDLAAATFLDSSGIAVLVVAHRLALAVGARYAVVNPTATVYEHLRLTGLADLFGVPRPAPNPNGSTGGSAPSAGR